MPVLLPMPTFQANDFVNALPLIITGHLLTRILMPLYQKIVCFLFCYEMNAQYIKVFSSFH